MSDYESKSSIWNDLRWTKNFFFHHHPTLRIFLIFAEAEERQKQIPRFFSSIFKKMYVNEQQVMKAIAMNMRKFSKFSINDNFFLYFHWKILICLWLNTHSFKYRMRIEQWIANISTDNLLNYQKYKFP